MKRRFDKYFYGQLACVVIGTLIIGLLYVRASAETVSITVTGPSQEVTVQPVSTTVTPEVVTVTAVVETVGTNVVEVAAPGSQGIPGESTAGEGGSVPPGGTTGQTLTKASGTDYDTTWSDAATGGASSWNELKDIPTEFPPAAHNQAAATITGLATVATSGSYPDLSNQPTFTRGYDGREIELQTSATHVQWRYVGAATWTDLAALADLAGTDGIDGDNYVCTITGGIRSLQYDKNGANPAPTMVPFGVELRKNGAVVTGTCAWTTPATSLLSGTSSDCTFTPTVAGTFVAATDNRVDVAITYGAITCSATAPVPATKVGADGLDGSPDGKPEIYIKIGTAVTGDVLNTTSGPADADGFAFRTVRINGNIHRADLVPGKTVIYSQTGDTTATVKFQVNKAGSTNPAVTLSAGGALVIY